MKCEVYSNISELGKKHITRIRLSSTLNLCKLRTDKKPLKEDFDEINNIKEHKTTINKRQFFTEKILEP